MEKPTSGGNPVTSGAGNEDEVKTNDTQQTDSSGSGVSNPHLDKVLREKRNYAAKAAELEAKIKELEENKLVESQKFESLWQQEKEARVQAESKYSQLSTKIEDNEKKSAIRSELVKLGLNPQHEQTVFRLMDTKDVFLDQDTGAIIGADHAAKAFHESFKDLGFFGRKTPGVSYEAPGVNVNASKPLDQLSKEEILQQLKSME
jgi:hypothetical protein